MEGLNAVHTRWLASVACCFPSLQGQPGPPTLDKYTEICSEQPLPPAIFNFDHVQEASRASRASQFLSESAPSDFRRVDLPPSQTPSFRPLQLSIYLPGNELPSLPSFQEEEEEDDAGLVYPAQALVKSRSDSMLSRPSASFSIPRKPVPSRTVSMDQSRSSTESRYIFNDLKSIVDSKSVHRRPSIAARQSTQEFLDALDARLPQLPPALQRNPGPEPVYTLYRRASEQSLRLRTHLEERSRIESEFNVLEEKQISAGKSKGLSPILDRDETTPVDKLLGSAKSISSPSVVSSDSPPKEVTTSGKNRRSIVSQWLLRTVCSQASLNSHLTPLAYSNSDDCTSRQQSTFRDRSSSASSTIHSSSTLADLHTTCTTPYSSPQKKTTSHHNAPLPRMSYDMSVPVETSTVGVAV
ncbi:MAG: hypothetical protein Q9200_005489 [Gallowayella weberi]